MIKIEPIWHDAEEKGLEENILNANSGWVGIDGLWVIFYFLNFM